MAETAANTQAEAKSIQISMNGDLATAILKNTKVEISPKGDVLVFTDTGITTKPAAEETVDVADAHPVSVSSAFNTVALYGAKIEVAPDGAITVATAGKVRIRPAADALIGTAAEDGWIYAGISPDTGKPMYAMPEDIGGNMTWEKALKIAKGMSKDKHTEVRLPSEGELQVMFNNRAKIGGFDQTGTYPSSYYTTSTPKSDDSYSVNIVGFKQGTKSDGLKELGRSVRLVRS